MIKVRGDGEGVVGTGIKGGADDIVEELLNVTIRIIELLVEKDTLPKEYVNDFIDDFAQQVKDNIKIEEDK